jgi:Tol biopolymer transport system component
MKIIVVLVSLMFSSIACKTKNTIVFDKIPPKDSISVYAFLREGKSYYTTDGKNLTLINNAYDLNISTTGKYLAYTDYYKSKGTNTSRRRIVILDLKTGSKSIINFPSEECYGPVWSNNDSLLAFRAMVNNRWSIVVSTKEKVVKVLGNNLDCSSLSWTADNRSIVTSNLDTVFIIDTSNIVTWKIPAKNLTRSVSSNINFIVVGDRQSLIFNAENYSAPSCDKKQYMVELPYAIFKYDIQDKKLTQLTPDGLFCGDYCISNNLLYFTANKNCSEQNNIYSMTLTGQNLKEFLVNASNIALPKLSK